METLLCSDAIFLAGSWHEAQKGNTQQGTLLGRLVLLLKIRGVGVQRMTREPESLLTVLCLESEGKQHQRPNGTELVLPKKNFVTSSDKGSQRKGARGWEEYPSSLSILSLIRKRCTLSSTIHERNTCLQRDLLFCCHKSPQKSQWRMKLGECRRLITRTVIDDVAVDYSTHLICCAESIVVAMQILELKCRKIRTQLK